MIFKNQKPKTRHMNPLRSAVLTWALQNCSSVIQTWLWCQRDLHPQGLQKDLLALQRLEFLSPCRQTSSAEQGLAFLTPHMGHSPAIHPNWAFASCPVSGPSCRIRKSVESSREADRKGTGLARKPNSSWKAAGMGEGREQNRILRPWRILALA